MSLDKFVNSCGIEFTSGHAKFLSGPIGGFKNFVWDRNRCFHSDSITPVIPVSKPYNAAGTGGRGSINAGALEASNVDLADELVTMIAYQRAFQANVRTVTTADEMLQEVSALKR